jgi:aspartate-semialdehyde dehydrogenase
MESSAFRLRERIDVGVLGATGMVGQQFIRLLANHPWFRPAWLAASERSEGRSYRDAASWRLPEDPPAEIADLMVEACVPGRGPRLIFSALDANAAKDIEPAFARAGHIVISNARSLRMDPSVPLLIPEINGDHLALMAQQQKAHGWSGAVVTNPNCSTVALTMVLAPLRQFGLRAVNVTTLQAVSGAGYPGVASMDIIGNVVPYISGEEEKMQSETQKILGAFEDGVVTPHLVIVSAHTTRVPVIDGHTLMASIKLDDGPSLEDVREALSSWRGRPQELGLPSAPPEPVVCLDQPDRPQPRRDALRGGGMAVSVGRIRPCPILGVKLAALGHNTIRGAAGAAVLNAELMVADGWIENPESRIPHPESLILNP